MVTPKVDPNQGFGSLADFVPDPPKIQDNGGLGIPAQTVGPSGQTAPDTAIPEPTTAPVQVTPQEPAPAAPAPSGPSLTDLPTVQSLSKDQEALFKLTQAASRPNYTPDIDGVPVNVNEANLASFWLRVNKQNNPAYIDPVTGRPVRVGPQAAPDPLTGEPESVADIIERLAAAGQPLSLEEQQVLEFREQVEFAIEDINLQAADFRATFTQSIIDTDQKAALANLDFQADARLEQIKRGQTGTPESRQASIDQANAQFKSAREAIEAEGREDTQTLQTILRLGERLTERHAEFNTEIDDVFAQLNWVDGVLGRAFDALDLDEAARASRAQEALTARLRSIEEQQLKLSVLQTFAAAPELIHFMGKQGTLGMFTGLLGEDDTTLDDLFRRLDERPTTNMQEFQRLTGEQQGIEKFRLSATTGTSDPLQTLQQEAPQGFGASQQFSRVRVGR